VFYDSQTTVGVLEPGSTRDRLTSTGGVYTLLPYSLGQQCPFLHGAKDPRTRSASRILLLKSFYYRRAKVEWSVPVKSSRGDVPAARSAHWQNWMECLRVTVQVGPVMYRPGGAEAGTVWSLTLHSSHPHVGLTVKSKVGAAIARSSSPGGGKNFHFSMSSGPALGSTQLPIQWTPGVKLPGHEADHSPPTSAEVKQMWIYIYTPPYVFMA
jgi:hypothetical protein